MADMSLDEYAETIFGREDPVLAGMRAEAEGQGLPAIQVPADLGRLLGVLVRQAAATRVLEIGTLFGYSGTLIARALPEEGRLVTLEANPKHADLARKNFERAGVSRKVELREGPALQTLESLQGSHFDLVFIDADKENYPAYLDWAVRLTRPGGLIIADNVWRNGAVTDPHDTAADAMAAFNRALGANPHLISTFIATRGGRDAASLSVVIS